jgi:hypothetical protein
MVMIVKELMALRMQLEDFVEAYDNSIKDRTNFTMPNEKPVILDISEEMKSLVKSIQVLAREQLFLIKEKSGSVTPLREVLQIIMGTSSELLETIETLHGHIRQYQKQGQLKKGLTQLLDWTSQLDYAEESAKMLLQQSRKILSSLARFEVLTSK